MTLKVLVYASIVALAAIAAPARAQAPSYQGALPADIYAPRRLAATPEGEPFVVDSVGRLSRLTRRGEIVGEVLEGVNAVASAPGAIFAALKDGTVAQVNPRTGRVVRELSLGTSEIPAALAYDAARAKLWIAFESGALQARSLDGVVQHQLVPSAGGTYRLVGVAVDPAGLVWAIQDRTGPGGTLHAYDAATGELVRSVPVPVRIAGGISVGAAGRVFVSDAFAGKVQMVESAGTDAGSIGSHGTEAGQLNQPTSVSFLPTGDLLVANMNGNRVDRFGGGAPLPDCAGDADCDGLDDTWEAANGLAVTDPTNAFGDADGDGLNDAEEFLLALNPRSTDSDGDGFEDGWEVANGFDPRSAGDHEPQLIAADVGPVGPGIVQLQATVRNPAGTGDSCSARWRQVSGTPVRLRGSTTASPSFVARAHGTYAFEGVPTCGSVSGAATRVEVVVSNVAPRADGGRVVAVRPGGWLLLSGEFSRDANADPLTFQWDQVAGVPAVGTVASRSLGTRLQQPGYYVFRLGVKDRAGAEGAAEVPVLVLGSAATPTAAAVSPVTAEAGKLALLDASPSYRGPQATFAWRQVSGAEVAIEGADTATASFVPPAPGKYAFEVDVVDGAMRAPPARVEVYAAAEGATLPAATASAPESSMVLVPVTLDGSASVGSGELAYAWRQVSGPAAGLSSEDRAVATAVLFEPGTYEFELSVSDGVATGAPVRVRVAGRSPFRPNPVAVATADASARVGEEVLLDGRESRGAVRYRWTQVAGPWVTIEQGETGSFRPRSPGVYGFELEVDDGMVRSAPARVNVVVGPGDVSAAGEWRDWRDDDDHDEHDDDDSEDGR